MDLEQTTRSGRLRTEALQLLRLDGTPLGPEFDELAELAASICGMPVGAMTLLDDTRVFTTATSGIPATTVPLSESVCQYTVQQNGVYVVEDLQADERFQDNASLVHRRNGIRFYAGTPIRMESGVVVGALCVLGLAPSTLSEAQKRSLELLGRQVSSRLQLRERAEAVAMLSVERERARTMMAAILNSIPMEVYLKDVDGAIQFYNRKLADRFRISQEEWLGKSSRDLWDPVTAEVILREDQYVLQTGQAHESYVELPSADGNVTHWKSIKVPCENASGQRVLACVSVEMTEQMQREAEMQRLQDELEEANRKLTSLALTDALTGLWNRRAFDARLETNIMAAQRSKQPMALMLIDIDHFKSINDRFGHAYGDAVLREVAALLNRVKRAEDVACRFGGEEFAILLPFSDIVGARRLGQRILEAFRHYGWQHAPVTTSIGVAMCEVDCTSDDLIDAADGALYRAKDGGRDCMITA